MRAWQCVGALCCGAAASVYGAVTAKTEVDISPPCGTGESQGAHWHSSAAVVVDAKSGKGFSFADLFSDSSSAPNASSASAASLSSHFARDAKLSKLQVWVFKEGLLSAAGASQCFVASERASETSLFSLEESKVTSSATATTSPFSEKPCFRTKLRAQSQPTTHRLRRDMAILLYFGSY